jgi:phosphomannomutase
MTYFASGKYDLPAAMFTASHNPASYNGIKFSRAAARGISLDTGLAQIRDRAKAFLENGIGVLTRVGGIQELDVTHDYANYLHGLPNIKEFRQRLVILKSMEEIDEVLEEISKTYSGLQIAAPAIDNQWSCSIQAADSCGA